MVTVSRENCWDCQNRVILEELDEVCKEHDITIWLHWGYWKNISTNLDCSCKNPIACNHKFIKANLETRHEFTYCKNCGVHKPKTVT
jgi:hypothetical protein